MTRRTRDLLRAIAAGDERRPFTLDEIRPVHELVSAIAGRERARDPLWIQRRELGLLMARHFGRLPARAARGAAAT